MSASSRLQKAIIKKDLEGVKSAITDGANVDSFIHKGARIYPSLIMAASVVGILATPIAAMCNTFIGLTLQKGTPEILKELLNAGANPNKDLDLVNSACKGARDQTTALLYAIHNNQTDFVHVLLESGKTDPFKAGVSFKVLRKINILPLKYAKEKGNTEIISMLEDYIANYLQIKKEVSIENFNKELNIEQANLEKIYKENMKELGINADDLTKKYKKEKVPDIVKKFSKILSPAKSPKS